MTVLQNHLRYTSSFSKAVSLAASVIVAERSYCQRTGGPDIRGFQELILVLLPEMVEIVVIGVEEGFSAGKLHVLVPGF